MYEYIPRKENNKAAHLILLMLVGGFLLLGVTTAFPTLPIRWLFQLVGILLIGVGIYLYTRYFARSYLYAVVPNGDGSLDLTVTELRHKSRVTVCRISLSGIERVIALPPSDREANKKLKKELAAEGRRLFSYTVNIHPPALTCLVATECGQPLAIFLEPDGRLAELLRGEN